MPFGQLVIGPPGSGKSTYCFGMYQFLQAVGRKCSVVNLDPANDHPNYPCALDIRDFTTLEAIMDEIGLGPNGGVMYALEQMDQAVDDFVAQVKALGQSDYILFDCPGQVELFTHHSSLQHVFHRLSKQLDFRLAVVHLVDSLYITSPTQYVSVLLLSLRSMLQMDLPHVNVLSKIDLVKSYGELPFRLDFYTEVQDIERLYPYMDNEVNTVLGKKYAKLTQAIGEVVNDYGLVQFEVLSVEDKRSMIHLLSVIDKANGYLFGTTEIGGDTVWAEATRQGGDPGYDVHERWIEHKDEYDELDMQEQRDMAQDYQVDPEVDEVDQELGELGEDYAKWKRESKS